MADFFERERGLFKEIESGSGLNEGDILKSIERLDAQIKQEEDMQASEDLAVATNPNISPEVAARYADRAGTGITTGDQLKKAKTTLKRMSKTLIDPNLSADAKEESLQRDRENLDQITLRTAYQGGRKGIAVTGETLAGKKAEELSGFGSEPLYQTEGKVFVNHPQYGWNVIDRSELTAHLASGWRERVAGEEAISPTKQPVTRGRFFPGPEETPERDLEQFMGTLETEDTLMRGEAGQRDIAEIKQRNVLRIAEFQAGRAKQVTLKPGERLFEVEPGRAEPLAQVPAAAPKEPTTIESALLQPGLSPERKQELVALKQALKGKGLKGRITLPDGTIISLGEEDDLGALTPGARTQIQKEIRDARGRLQEFTNLTTNPQFNPEKNLTFYSAGLAKLGGFLDEISPTISNAFQLKDNITDWNAFLALTENLFTSWRRSVTGVAFRPEEEIALRKAFPSTKDGPTAYRAKLEAVKELNKRIITRLQTWRPGDKIDVLGELATIQSASPAAASRRQPPPAGGTLDLSQFKR